METMLNWAANGLWDLNGWQIVLFVLVMTHITMISVTVFLHRHQAHRALDLHPVVSHFFRFWLWLTTGQVTKEWAAIHRKHHAKCEQAEDPHSPHVHGIKTNIKITPLAGRRKHPVSPLFTTDPHFKTKIGPKQEVFRPLSSMTTMTYAAFTRKYTK